MATIIAGMHGTSWMIIGAFFTSKKGKTFTIFVSAMLRIRKMGAHRFNRISRNSRHQV
jgi:hypothetical protein